MVSNPDLGRQIQIGLYGGPSDYSAGGPSNWINLGWDPIQAGDYYGNPSEVLIAEQSENLLHTKTIPKQFAFNNQPGEATIEHWIHLEGNVVKVHAKVVLSRADKTQYEARQQEFPCMYLTGEYHNMWYYKEGSPYTNGQLTLSRIQPPQTSFNGDIFPTEPWVASTNENGYGAALYVADNYEWKNGYFGADLGGDEFSTLASYVAATPKVVFDYNLSYEWDYELVLGQVNDIRQYIYAKKHAPTGPQFRFDTTRKGWSYRHATDTGWPIKDKLHIFLDDASNAQIFSPFVFWKGRDNPKLYLRAAFNTKSEKFRLNWRHTDDITLYDTGDRIFDFPVINDSQYHTYEIDLSQVEHWLSTDIGQIELEPVTDQAQPGSWVEFAWLGTSPEGPSSEDIQPVDPPIVNPTPCLPGCVTISVKRIR